MSAPTIRASRRSRPIPVPRTATDEAGAACAPSRVVLDTGADLRAD